MWGVARRPRTPGKKSGNHPAPGLIKECFSALCRGIILGYPGFSDSHTNNPGRSTVPNTWTKPTNETHPFLRHPCRIRRRLYLHNGSAVWHRLRPFPSPRRPTIGGKLPRSAELAICVRSKRQNVPVHGPAPTAPGKMCCVCIMPNTGEAGRRPRLLELQNTWQSAVEV